VTKPKLTPDIHSKLIQFFSLGAFKKHAANACGITELQLDEWLELGREGRAPYDQLFIDIERAIADDAIRNQMIVSRAAAGQPTSGDWKAAAWNLERKHPKLYGRAATEAAKTGGTSGEEKPTSPWLNQTA
jgi:hypothetical protein